MNECMNDIHGNDISGYATHVPVLWSFHLEEEEEKMRIAILLRNTRAKAGLTQRQLAQKAGVPQPSIARIESWSTKGVPGICLLAKLFSAMGYKLVFGVERMTTLF